MYMNIYFTLELKKVHRHFYQRLVMSCLEFSALFTFCIVNMDSILYTVGNVLSKL